jgi:hypothetical protein
MATWLAETCNRLCKKGKTFPVLAYYRAGGYQEAEAPKIRESLYMKVSGCKPKASANFTPENIHSTHFC